MHTTQNCEICNNSEFYLYIKSEDFSVSQKEFKIVKCKNCNFIFTNPRPKDENLGEYYISEKYISHTNTSKGLFEKLYQLVRKHAIKGKFKLASSLIKEGFILDIGCGTGEFLNKCKENNWETKGIEPSKIARKQAQSNFNLNVSESTDLDEIEEKVDIISMWHVLEHVPNLNETLEEFNRILKHKGNVIIAVPNLESYDASYYKKHWAAYDLPIHLHHFSENSISKLFKKYNFKLIKTKGMKFDSYYVSLLSEEYKFGKKNFIKSFIIGSISNLFGLFTKRGYSSTIYIFEKGN